LNTFLIEILAISNGLLKASKSLLSISNSANISFAKVYQKLFLYSKLKSYIKLEDYLKSERHFKNRQLLTKFRLSDHNLEIELGRCKNIPRNQRLTIVASTVWSLFTIVNGI
jgi:hypothetical protein